MPSLKLFADTTLRRNGIAFFQLTSATSQDPLTSSMSLGELGFFLVFFSTEWPGAHSVTWKLQQTKFLLVLMSGFETTGVHSSLFFVGTRRACLFCPAASLTIVLPIGVNARSQQRTGGREKKGSVLALNW